jgi:hypothetical protein
VSNERAFTPEIERLLAGELSEAEAGALRARYGDEELERLTLIHEQQRDELLRERGPEQFAHLIKTRAAHEARALAPGRAWKASLVLAVLAALALWLPNPRVTRVELPNTQERIKGMKPELLIYRRTGSGVQDLKRGAEVRAHDTLQIAYVAAGHSHGVILSIDGAGTVTLHSPRDESSSGALVPSGRHLLDRSYELDGAPSFERFILVASQRPVDVRRVLDAARALARTAERARRQELALPDDYVQTSFELRKGAP